MKLYSMPHSGQIICASIIAELGLECETIFVDEAVRNSSAFRRISPYGRVPALEADDGEVLFESLAITLYLLEGDHEGRLAPRPGTPGHGRFLSWMAYLATTFYDAILRWHYPERYGEAAGVKAMADSEIAMIYDHIESEANPWLVGGRMTVADRYLTMMIGWDDDGREARLATHPKVKQIFDAVRADAITEEVMALHGPRRA